jgi:transcriptional regulator with XRE-family HTH domain
MGKTKRDSPRKLAEKLKQIRLSLELSQGDMASRLGLKERASVSGYENGTREPPLPILLKYARLVGVSTDVLIDDKLKLPRS